MSGAVAVTQADREAVTAFHNAQLQRIFMGDRTLGENRDAIEQAFARHRHAAEAASKQQIAELVEALAKALPYVTQAWLATGDPLPDALMAEIETTLARAKASSDGGEG